MATPFDSSIEIHRIYSDTPLAVPPSPVGREWRGAASVTSL
jgi:hypothetical protein